MVDKVDDRGASQQRLKSGFFQYAKFNMISFGNWALDVGFLNLFLWIGPTSNHVMLLLYNTVAYIAAVTNSYIWNTRITFRKHLRKGHRQKVLFASQAGVSLVINNIVFFAGIKLLSTFSSSMWLVDNGAKEISMFCSSTASFFFMKWIVFRKKS